MHLICFDCFPKEYSSTFVLVSGLTKLLMETSSAAEIKSCRSAIMNFTVCLFVSKVSGNLKSKASNLVLDIFIWSVIFYDVGFSWCMLLVAEKKFSSISNTCYIFHAFHFDALIKIPINYWLKRLVWHPLQLNGEFVNTLYMKDVLKTT